MTSTFLKKSIQENLFSSENNQMSFEFSLSHVLLSIILWVKVGNYKIVTISLQKFYLYQKHTRK